jgi:hypothetical protein
MATLDSSTKDETEGPSLGLQAHQLRAVAAPHLPLSQLVGDEAPSGAAGNFKDLESLLDQLGAPPVFELGSPLPGDKYLPKSRVGSCPASHNRALLDEEAD